MFLSLRIFILQVLLHDTADYYINHRDIHPLGMELETCKADYCQDSYGVPLINLLFRSGAVLIAEIHAKLEC